MILAWEIYFKNQLVVSCVGDQRLYIYVMLVEWSVHIYVIRDSSIARVFELV